ncbi:neprilysin-1-like [Drosophila sulfurigaster albostrigata]|uniref:neprilysin-1-like n=1 Tax=Drosophila sulfurigaster albostrigata TaxID=89887 RepID=UPI002D21DE3B|nr:neprilysin-1-like [Drosophila sulfurigaster albostrigata]
MKCCCRRSQLQVLLLMCTWTLVRPRQIKEFNERFLQQMLRNMNESIDPCEDFYGYACGKWSENYNDSDSYLDMPGYMEYKYNLQLLRVLKMEKQQGGIYEQLWAYYASCVDLTSPAINEFLHLLEGELQLEWPIFRSNQSATWRNESHFDWWGTLAKLRSYGLNGVFISQDANVRRDNGSHYVLMLAPQAAEATPFNEQSIQDLYLAFGLDKSSAKQLTAKLMQLEWRLGNLTLHSVNSSISSLVECTLSQLQQRLPQLDWRHYLSNLLLERQPDEQLLVQVHSLNASYLQQLQLILGQSSNETICYYLMFKLIYALNTELPMSSEGDTKSQSMSCVQLLRGHMPLAIHYIYEMHNYGKRRQQTDAALQQLQHKLRFEFEQLLLENHLQLGKQEQAYVLEELHSLRLKIGNLPPRLTMQQLLEYYKQLQLRPNDFYGNTLQLLQFYNRREQQLLSNKPSVWSSQDYYQLAGVVERSSSPVKIFQNAVLVPQGYLQLPLFDVRLPMLHQHAQFGFILAHELQHAFDLFHIVYDARGNYNATGSEVLQHFDNFISCYSNAHNVPQLQLSESMADLVGLRLAFASYFDHKESVVADEQRPVGKFTAQQLFFINSVQFLCANMQQIGVAAGSQDVEHGMHNERVNRNWPHHEHFAGTFNCTVGQAMYQPQTCRLW